MGGKPQEINQMWGTHDLLMPVAGLPSTGALWVELPPFQPYFFSPRLWIIPSLNTNCVYTSVGPWSIPGKVKRQHQIPQNIFIHGSLILPILCINPVCLPWWPQRKSCLMKSVWFPSLNGCLGGWGVRWPLAFLKGCLSSESPCWAGLCSLEHLVTLFLKDHQLTLHPHWCFARQQRKLCSPYTWNQSHVSSLKTGGHVLLWPACLNALPGEGTEKWKLGEAE